MLSATNDLADPGNHLALKRLQPLDLCLPNMIKDTSIHDRHSVFEHLLDLCLRTNNFVASQARFDCMTAALAVPADPAITATERLHSLRDLHSQAQSLLIEGDRINAIFEELKTPTPHHLAPTPAWPIRTSSKSSLFILASESEDAMHRIEPYAEETDWSDEYSDDEDEEAYLRYEKEVVIETATAVTITPLKNVARTCKPAAMPQFLRHVRQRSNDLRSDAGFVDEHSAPSLLVDDTTASEGSELDEAEEIDQHHTGCPSIVSDHDRGIQDADPVAASPLSDADFSDKAIHASAIDYFNCKSESSIDEHIEKIRQRTAECLVSSQRSLISPDESPIDMKNHGTFAGHSIGEVLGDFQDVRLDAEFMLGISAGRRNAVASLGEYMYP